MNIIFFPRSAEQNPKHPPKTTTQELRKMASQLSRPYFAPSVCAKLCCSISPKYTRIYYSKHPPKMANQELRKMTFRGFQPCFIFYPCKSNPQHNGHTSVSPTHPHQSIKVTPQKWRKRTLKNEWCNVFSKVFLVFQKWTFIFVHFSFFSFRFEKNVENLTQTIMLSFGFLSWKFCYDKFLDIFKIFAKKV